jgi:hypothetical protein
VFICLVLWVCRVPTGFGINSATYGGVFIVIHFMKENKLVIISSISLLTDFVCLYNYEFWLSLCKIIRSSVILLLPLFSFSHFVFSYKLSCDVNLVPPVTILAASNWIFSNLFIKFCFWLSHITSAYSIKGLIKEIKKILKIIYHGMF